ncbi:MAG: hemolysin family protein [Candidatus Zixiibacteriota bacterium]
MIIALPVALVTLVVGYLSSVFAASVLIDPEQIDEITPGINKSARVFLRRLEQQPAMFLQVAMFYKWLTLLVMALVSFFWSPALSGALGVPESLAFSILLVALSLLSFVALEALPRRHSLRRVDGRLLRLVPLMRLALAFSGWFVSLQRKTVARPEEEITEDVKEEIVERAIETLADQVGAGEKLVEETERQMIESIFHLDSAEAAEIMSPRVDLIAVPRDISLPEFRKITAEHGHSRYPVYEDTVDAIVGVIYIKDIFTNPPADKDTFSVTGYMKEAYFVPQDIKLGDLLTAFKARKVHLAIVVDEFGGTAGIVTLEDILEEIVGDIQDEHDEEEAEFVDRGAGVYELDGGFPLSEFRERLGIAHSASAFETVAGVIYDLCGSVPSEGSELRWGDVTFVVTRLDGQRIERIRALYRKS